MRINTYLKIILLILLTSFISCGNPMTDPNDNNDNNNNSTNNTIKIEYPIYLNYGSNGSTINNYEELESLWKGMVNNKTIYADSSYSTITGNFGEDTSYYEKSWDNGNTPRTKFLKCSYKEINGKNYIAGIYWDNKTGVGMRIRYRLIVIDDSGVEHAWYGGGGDENVIPDENTDWTYYTFRFGWLKEY